MVHHKITLDQGKPMVLSLTWSSKLADPLIRRADDRQSLPAISQVTSSSHEEFTKSDKVYVLSIEQISHSMRYRIALTSAAYLYPTGKPSQDLTNTPTLLETRTYSATTPIPTSPLSPSQSLFPPSSFSNNSMKDTPSSPPTRSLLPPPTL